MNLNQVNIKNNICTIILFNILFLADKNGG